MENDVSIDTKVSRNGAWALEKVVFNNHKATVETSRHTTETALSLYAWHGVDGSTSNNVISGAIDFFCTNGMVTGDYSKIRKKNTRHFDMGRITHEMDQTHPCLLYTSPSPRDGLLSRMPSSA